MQPQAIDFPRDFIFGIADSDLQVIGESFTRSEEQSEESMWSHFAKHSSVVFQHDSPSIAIDRYHKWHEDIELMSELGIKHYRTSVSMSRILKRDGSVNKNALEWYKTYFQKLRSKGISIYATLYHWELPQFIEEQGGWKNKKTIEWFSKHAHFVVEHLGEYISEYFVLNEPRCSSLVAYYYGQHAPGGNSLTDALLAGHHLLLAQGIVINELQKKYHSLKLSTAINVGVRYAASVSKEDVLAARVADGHKNRWFLDPMFYGKYPDDMLELYGNRVPSFTKAEMQEICIGNKIYTLGLNYYRGDIVKANKSKELGFETFIHKDGPTSDLGWGIYVPPYYQEGLYDVLGYVYERYKDYGVNRIYITENGMALHTPLDTNSNTYPDQRRIDFYKQHLTMVHNAIKRGVPVVGFFPWTFMDNYEWQEGYKPDSSFGMVHIDRNTLERKPKESYFWYKTLIQNRSFS